MDGHKKGGKNLTPESIGFSKSNMDMSADPYEDFYRYANGKWIDSNPVPADKSSWGAFYELHELNMHRLGEILEECASKCTENGKTNIDLVGRFYKSVMNTEEIEKRKFNPVRGLLEKIDSIQSRESLVDMITEMHRSGTFPLFTVFSENDQRNSAIYALYFYQGGLTLPNRDYYIEERFRDVKEYYGEYIKKVWKLYGMAEEGSEKYSSIIMDVENAIAGSSRKQEDLRDAEKNYNKFTIVELNKKYRNMGFEKYLDKMGIRGIDYVIVGQPEFFEFLNKFLASMDLENLKIYLKWIALNNRMPYLNKEAEDLHFDMFYRKIRGQKEKEERWKKAVHIIDSSIGEALGEIYVKKYFTEESRKRMETMISDIREVFTEKVNKLPWMSEETKRKALQKFSKFRVKIGNPPKFRDYSSIQILSGDLTGNVARAWEFEVKRQAERAGKEVDRDEWYMTPPTINAYFNPTENEIVFPAGIIQPPFFDPNMDDAVNYGGIGSVICHEITHGYDDQGRRYDENGNLGDWWTEEDAKKFSERADKISELYSSLEVLPGFKVNGKLTLGENIADFGGVSIAYEALQKHLEKHPELRKEIDGFTPEQRFFLSCSQIWRQNTREETLKMLISMDPHSPARFRGMVPLQNHPEFKSAFKSTKGLDKPVYSRDITIW